MSKENLEQFMSKVADSEELQAKIGEEIDAEALIALGAECGCEFTAEELQDSAELSDEELGTVAGGVTPAGKVTSVKIQDFDANGSFCKLTIVSGGKAKYTIKYPLDLIIEYEK